MSSHAGGGLLLAAPQRLVRRLLVILWESDGSDIHAGVAAAGASAGAFRQVVVPLQRHPVGTTRSAADGRSD